jgi:hypothetical protein
MGISMSLFNDGEEEEKLLSIVPEELTDVEDKQKRKRKSKNKTVKRKKKSITWDD